jgi:ribosome-binding factor A
MPSYRVQRVQSQIFQAVSIVLHDEIRDPRVKNVTVTDVKAGSDLRNVTIYYSVLGDADEKKKAAIGLTHACPFVRKELGARINLRYNPEIRFEYDETIEKAAHIAELLNIAKKQNEDNHTE